MWQTSRNVFFLNQCMSVFFRHVCVCYNFLHLWSVREIPLCTQHQQPSQLASAMNRAASPTFNCIATTQKNVCSLAAATARGYKRRCSPGQLTKRFTNCLPGYQIMPFYTKHNYVLTNSKILVVLKMSAFALKQLFLEHCVLPHLV